MVFTIVHDLVISDIWDMWVPMVIAGAAAGASLAWAHDRLVDEPTVRSWFGLHAVYVLLLVGLGLWSILVFEPVTTTAALIAADEPPDELIAQALPGTAVFTVLGAAAVTRLVGDGWRAFGPTLVATVVVVATLGLNLSVLGLVSFSGSDALLVAELVGLVIVLAASNAILGVVLSRTRPGRHDALTLLDRP